MMKLSAAVSESSRRSLDGISPETVKETYQFGRLVESRIRERATMINLKLGRECLGERDSPEFEWRDDRYGRSSSDKISYSYGRDKYDKYDKWDKYGSDEYKGLDLRK